MIMFDIQHSTIGIKGPVPRFWRQLLLGACLGVAVHAQTPSSADSISVRTIAEVETRVTVAGHEVVKLAPADRLVPADQVIYTLEVHNTDASAATAPTVTYPIPEHMVYIANSAIGPGADVSYSLDGHSFDKPENLTVPGTDGRLRPATAADYTHIRWQFRHSLKANSTAFVRFRALVK
jgi:uncharacterized repeat protein (TIGR01451 family)